MRGKWVMVASRGWWEINKHFAFALKTLFMIINIMESQYLILLLWPVVFELGFWED